ncbi:ABC transporter transmembrane domain-containing protein [Ruegeria jejuensis]|uniref:ABC transporter transmembrane domain-containing protein n=1 Tax=Ruegeria jejuensis TaxID=3233338 RepID=UPI00355C1FDB
MHTGETLAIRTVCELAISSTIGAICLFFSRREAERLGQSYSIALRRVLYEQIASLPKSRHEERRVGALSLRFVGDLSAARLWFGRGLPDVLTAGVVLPGAVAILFALDPSLARIGVLPVGGALVLMVAVAWTLERRHQYLRRRRANIAITMIERIAIAPELDLMGRTNKELRALDKRGTSLKQDAVSRRSRATGLQAIVQVGVALSGLAILWTASRSGTAPATVAASLSVLALVAMPLQDLGAAWDKFCAWRVAREKAHRLLREPSVQRQAKSGKVPTSVTVRGRIGNEPLQFTAEAGSLTTLKANNAIQLARLIAGLDRIENMELLFNGQTKRPHVYYIGDDHVGLQGSLRRSATLSTRKRPKNARVAEVLSAFGLADLLRAPDGLNQRLSENGKGLTPAQSLRLDMARSVLGHADVIVISSLRWSVDPDRKVLLDTLRRLTPATVILVEADEHLSSTHKAKTN